MRPLQFFILFLAFKTAAAQSFRAGIAYQYMSAGNWDKAIQTYNFSRPSLSQKQPVFTSGFNASFSYFFKSSKNLSHGINLSYSGFESAAENANLSNVLTAHFLAPGYVLHYENKAKSRGLYSELAISALSSLLLRNVNGEPFLVDGSRFMAWGVGADISLRIGKRLKSHNKMGLKPYIQAGFTPYLYSPNAEAAINQTKGLVSSGGTAIFNLQAGLSIHFAGRKRGEGSPAKNI